MSVGDEPQVWHHLQSSVHFKFVDRTSWRGIGKRCSIPHERVSRIFLSPGKEPLVTFSNSNTNNVNTKTSGSFGSVLIGLGNCFPRNLYDGEWDLVRYRKHWHHRKEDPYLLTYLLLALASLTWGWKEDCPICVGPEWGWSQGNRRTEKLKESPVQNKDCRDGACGLTCTKLANS